MIWDAKHKFNVFDLYFLSLFLYSNNYATERMLMWLYDRIAQVTSLGGGAAHRRTDVDTMVGESCVPSRNLHLPQAPLM